MLMPGAFSDTPNALLPTMTTSPSTIVTPKPAANAAIDSHGGHPARPGSTGGDVLG